MSNQDLPVDELLELVLSQAERPEEYQVCEDIVRLAERLVPDAGLTGLPRHTQRMIATAITLALRRADLIRAIDGPQDVPPDVAKAVVGIVVTAALVGRALHRQYA